MKKISNPFVPLFLKLQGIQTGKNRYYGFPIILARHGKISIGKGCVFNSGELTNLLGMWQRCIIFARDGGDIRIGNHVAMSGTTVYSFCHIEIGDHTLIGVNTKIIDSDMHPIDPAARLENPQNRELMGKKEIIIGKNVFIGCNCLILKGVHIGDNSVIGAGSIVTNDIPANVIAAGNPARILKDC